MGVGRGVGRGGGAHKLVIVHSEIQGKGDFEAETSSILILNYLSKLALVFQYCVFFHIAAAAFVIIFIAVIVFNCPYFVKSLQQLLSSLFSYC